MAGRHVYVADRVRRLDLGVAFERPLVALSPTELAEGLSEAYSSSRPNLPTLAKRMVPERGVANAADRIEALLGRHVGA